MDTKHQKHWCVTRLWSVHHKKRFRFLFIRCHDLIFLNPIIRTETLKTTCIQVRLSNLREVRVLGKGGFGLVRCVRDKASGEEFALKAISKTRLKTQGFSAEEIRRERDAQVTIAALTRNLAL
jgi:hypothetical protein